MEMINVKSSNIRSVGYSIDEKILKVVFVNGGVYKYNNVDNEIFEKLLSSPSIGKYFNSVIAKNYGYIKIN